MRVSKSEFLNFFPESQSEFLNFGCLLPAQGFGAEAEPEDRGGMHKSCSKGPRFLKLHEYKENADGSKNFAEKTTMKPQNYCNTCETQTTNPVICQENRFLQSLPAVK